MLLPELLDCRALQVIQAALSKSGKRVISHAVSRNPQKKAINWNTPEILAQPGTTWAGNRQKTSSFWNRLTFHMY